MFFYLKPESNHDDDGIARCKCVAEFRMFCSKFLDISRDINIKVKDIEREGKKYRRLFRISLKHDWEGHTLKTCQSAHLGKRHEFE